MQMSFTNFPNLYDTVGSEHAAASVRETWPVALSEHSIVLSWSALLQAYTTIADPVFLLGGKPIHVSLENSSWEAVDAEDHARGNKGYTSVTILKSHGVENRPGELVHRILPTCAVHFTYVSDTGEAVLTSKRDAPPGFLPELLAQLRSLQIQGVHPAAQFDGRLEPASSVANTQREILPGPSLLHHLIKWPENHQCAVDFLSRERVRTQIDYQQLGKLSDNLADSVKSICLHSPLNGSRDKVVPVLIEQSPELYLAQIAILKSGAAFCPLNLDVPLKRLAFIVHEVGAMILLTTSAFQERVAAAVPGVKILLVDDPAAYDGSQVIKSRPQEEHTEVLPTDLAYVMYTSGSTGLPKGVRISHQSVTQSILAHDGFVPPYSRFLQFAAPTFDVSVFEIFFTLYRGVTLVCCYREDLLGNLPAVISQLQVDAVELTPSIAETLLRSWDVAPSLQVLLTIGEKLSDSVIQKFASDDTDRALIPLYGPTEASIHCMVALNMGKEAKAGAIGRPLSTVSAFIVTEDQSQPPRLLPRGFVGELAVAGQLAGGYVDRPEQTAMAFVHLVGHGMVYRTGDRARMLPSGEFDCLGRISEGQIKLRGQRVELSEIELVLSQVGSISLAVARIIDGNLVAFCLIAPKAMVPPTLSDIKQHCKAWLPSFMQPADIVLLGEGMPQLPSGKVDTKVLDAQYLRAREQNGSQLSRDTSDLEASISDMIHAQLGLSISPACNLRSSGVDSLRAIRLASMLSSNNLRISATDILSADTLEQLSEIISQGKASTKMDSDLDHKTSTQLADLRSKILANLPSLARSRVQDILPCSRLQCALLSESTVWEHVNFNRILIDLNSPVTPVAFADAFRQLAHFNPILRSSFVYTEDRTLPYLRLVWENIDKSIHIRQMSTDHSMEEPQSTITGADLSCPLQLEIAAFKDKAIANFSIHHALYDGWSWDLIMNDLKVLISGDVPARRPQFDRFVRFENHVLNIEEVETAKEYWTKQLTELTPEYLPVLTSAKSEKGNLSCKRSINVELNAVSQDLGISRHSIPSAAFGTLLHLYCGAADVVYGSVSSGRTLPIPGIDTIIGPCISTLPVRLTLDHVHTTKDLLLLTHQLHHNFLRFGNLPLGDLKALSGIPSDQDLFDTLFVWQEGPNDVDEAQSALTVTEHRDALRYSLVLEAEPSDQRLQLKATYDQSVLDSLQMDVFMNQLEAIIKFFAKHINTPWKEALYNIQSKDLSIANSKITSVESLPLPSATVDELAATDPDRIAIEFVEDLNLDTGSTSCERLSYYDLSKQSSAVGQRLSARGVVADELVCLFMEKSLPLYISILAILKAGAAYVVIDPRGPPERMSRILDATKCQYGLTRIQHRGHSLLARIPNLLTFDDMSYDEPAVHFKQEPCRNALAYSIFTSGSTGIPKGVLITRGNILSNIDVLSRIYPIPDKDGAFLQACSATFDVSVFEILFTWHMGMRLCAASNDILFRDLEAFIRQLRITHLSLTPTVAAIVNPDNVPTVRMLVTAGEAVTAKVFAEWAGRGLIQGYGPSETTNICSAYFNVSSIDHQNNIGQPFSNTSLFIFDPRALRPLPKGALGEIWIGGDQVGRGYLNDAELTNEKFRLHPQYGRLYRSGDLGRMLPNGDTLFHGRQDDQVKLRGQRIQLGAIEHALVQLPVVADSTCLLIKIAKPATARLVAFWCSSRLSTAEPANSIKFMFDRLSAQLPSYMIPDYLLHIDSLPRTSQGKIDKKALHQLFEQTNSYALQKFAREDDSNNDGKLENPAEEQVAQLLADITGTPIDSIGRNTSFYALGLDSMACISFAKKLPSVGLPRVDVSTILRHTTVARLVRHLTNNSSHGSKEFARSSKAQHMFDEEWMIGVKCAFSARGFDVIKILPPTPLQEVMLSSSEATGTQAYHNRLTFSVTGNMAQLRAAWTKCVVMHEILRTAFVATASPEFPYAQVVFSAYEPSWIFEDQALQKPKHLTDAGETIMPPYAFCIEEQFPSRDTKLTLQIHHALYDGQAIATLLQDVEQAYRSCEVFNTTSLEPYLDYMLSLDATHVGNFWQRHLTGFVPKLMVRLPEDQLAKHAHNESSLTFCTSISLHEVTDSTRKYNVSLLSLLQLSWVKLLTHYSDSMDICFGNIYSGRTLDVVGIEKLVGPCFNTLPVRMVLHSGDTNRQVATRLHNHNLEVLPLQPCSLRRIQHDQGARRLFDTVFLLQAEDRELDSSIWTLDSDMGAMGLPLVIEILPESKAARLQVTLHSDQTFLKSPDLQSLAQDFDHFLQHVTQYLDAEAIPSSTLQQRSSLTPTFYGSNEVNGTPAGDGNLLGQQGWTQFEEDLLAILKKLSHRATHRATKDTNIFHLGFDSISVAQLAAELRKRGHNVTSADIMEASTIANIALLCHENKGSPSSFDTSYDLQSFNDSHLLFTRSRLLLDEKALVAIRPCTPFQSGIVADFLRSNGNNHVSNITYEINEDVSTGRLRAQWQTIVARHEILRTGFIELDDRQSPFGMICYSVGAVDLPYHEVDDSSVQDSMSDNGPLFEVLYKPPWRVCIDQRDKKRLMRLTILHALFDATSLEIILEELSMAYQGKRLGQVVPITPCLSRILRLSSLEPSQRSKIAAHVGSLPKTKFPELHPEFAQANGSFKCQQYCSRTLSQVREQCREAGVTLQIAGQSAWARLLAAYTGEKEVVFGVVLTGRFLDAGEDRAVFPCITTVPFPVSVFESNHCLLSRSSRYMTQILRNPYVGLSSAVTSSPNGRLFDTLFVLQNPSRSHTIPPWSLSEESSSVDFALSIELVPSSDDRLQFALTFQGNILPDQQAKLLLNQFDAVLIDTLDNLYEPASRLSELKHDLLSTLSPRIPWIETKMVALHDCFEVSAEAVPESSAFEFVSDFVPGLPTMETWTYADLDRFSNRVARYLQNHGAEVGDLVGICFPKCLEAPATILGILKAGCAYLALDPDAPEARKKFILGDAGVRLLCTLQNQVVVPELDEGTTVLAMDGVHANEEFPSQSPNLTRQLLPDDICYCLYTSGTTGAPKGCLITHGSAVQFVLAFQELFAGHWDSQSRFLQFASLQFDVSVMEHFFSWSVGITVTAAPRDLLLEDIATAIRTLQITHVDLTPSLALLVSPLECPTLCKGAFITGGERLRQEIIDAWADKGVLYNGYGPSEVTIGCTMYPRLSKLIKASNIGFAYPNAGIHIIDAKYNKPSIRGAIGELCVSGPLVGKGYLNRPQLTAEKFVHIEGAASRAYRTGDLVRLLHDDSILFVGRADDQIKLRGQRLEVGEINSIIQKTASDIKDVVTMVTARNEIASDQLVTFIVVKGTPSESSDNTCHVDVNHRELLYRLRQTCTAALPAYMVPSHFISVNKLPLTANNKIDEKALTSFFQALSVNDLSVLSLNWDDRTNLDPKILDKVRMAVSKATGLSAHQIEVSSQLFELGIDSISVTYLSRILRASGFETASQSMIMQHSVVADLTVALTIPSSESEEYEKSKKQAQDSMAAFEKAHRENVARVLGLEQHVIQYVAPCTSLQEGMISQHLSHDKLAYSSSFIFRLQSDLDQSRLQAAWEEVAEHNEILRTVFVLTSDGYAQVVLRDLVSSMKRFQHIFFRSATYAEQVARDEFFGWANYPYFLQNRPWTVNLYEGPESKEMILNMFHGLYDGVSLDLLMQEVACAYEGISSPGPKLGYHESLPLGPLQARPGSKDFWKSNLVNVRPMHLPLKSSKNEPISIRSNFVFPVAVRKLQSRLEVTETAMLQACWLMALDQTFKIWPTIGIVVSGRAIEVDGIQNTIGPLFNTIPCHIEAHTESSVSEMVKECHRFNAEVIRYQHTPLSKISKWLNRPADQSLFDSLLVMQRARDDASGSSKLWQLIDSISTPPYPLAIEMKITSPGTINYTILAQSQRVSWEQTEALSTVFQNNLGRLPDLAHRPARQSSDVRSLLNGASLDEAVLGNPELNSVKEQQEGTRPEYFSWNSESTLLRKEIAKLADIDMESVTAFTSIFELGLDSIDAIKLSARLKAAKIPVAMSKIMQAGCVAEMMKHITTRSGLETQKHILLEKAQRELTEDQEISGFDVCKGDIVLPVTPLQEAMLAKFKQYYMQDVLEIAPAVDHAKLRDAWYTVLSTHDIFRTRFVEINDLKSNFTFAQVIGQDPRVQIHFENLHDAQELPPLLEVLRQQATSQGITQLPIRLTFVTIGKACWLILGLSHALYDGWSISLLHQDVLRCYQARQCDRPKYMPMLERILQSNDDQTRSFWGKLLGNLKPRMFPRLQIQQPPDTTIFRYEITAKTPLPEIKAFCKTYGVSLQSLALTCWALTVAHYLQSQDVCFGSVMAGRDVEGADQMMFPTMNTVPIRAIIKGSKLDVVKALHSLSLSITEHQHFPLRQARMLVRDAPVCLFDTLFIYQKRPNDAQSALVLYKSKQGLADPEYPVNVEFEALGEQAVWRSACASDVSIDEPRDSLLQNIDQVLCSICSHPTENAFASSLDGVSICDLPRFVAWADAAVAEDVSSTKKDDESELTSLDEILMDVLEGVTGTDRSQIKKSSNIFQLGLDSISAVKVSTALKRRSVRLSASDIMKALTVGEMARVVKAAEEFSTTSPSARPRYRHVDLINDGAVQDSLKQSGLCSDDVERVLPCTAGQKFFLGMWQASGQTIFYPSFDFVVHGVAEIKGIDEAWRRLVRMMPVLRTSFLAVDLHGDLIVQVVLQNSDARVHWLEDETIIFSNEKNVQRRRIIGPARLMAARNGDDVFLKLRIHHALYDGISLPTMMRLFQDMCNRPSLRPALPADFSSYLAFLRAETVEDQKRSFWTSYLSRTEGQQRFEARPPMTPRTEIFRPRIISDLHKIYQTARGNDFSIQALFIAAYALAHARSILPSPITELIAGIYLANRSHEYGGLPELVAPVVNVVPVRIPVSSPWSLLQNARKVQHDLGQIGSITNSTVSLEQIHDWTGKSIDLFINFLALPRAEEVEVEEGDKITIGNVDSKAPSVEIFSKAEGVAASPYLNTIPCTKDEVYLPSIDVEAAVRNEGLDVGIFAPSGLLNTTQANRLLEELRSVLEDISM